MKKKIVALLLCVTMAAAVTGCGKEENQKTPGTTEAVLDTEAGSEISDSEISSASIEYVVKDYVKLGDYKGIDVTIDQDYTVDDDDVRDYVNNSVIANNPFLKEVDKDTVESGDFVNIDYEGTRDGEAFAGGTATGYDLEIGSDAFIPGFEDGIIGMKVGEEKDLNLTFPENYTNSDLAGAEVVFHVKVNKIQAKEDMTYDTFTDEYTSYYAQKNNMTYTSAEELLADIRSYLEGTAMNQRMNAIATKALPELLEICSVDGYPDGMLDAVIREAKDTYLKGYGAMYGTLESIAENVFNLSLEEFEAKVEDEAEQNLKIEMILDAIADEEKLEIDEESFGNYVQNLMSNNSFESEDALYLNYADTAEEGKAALKKEYLRLQALTYVVNEADVSVEADTEAEGNTESVAGTEAE